jgi:hypothetical protein
MPNPRRYAQAFYKTRQELKGITAAGLDDMSRLVANLRAEVTEQLSKYSPADPEAPFTTRLLPDLTKSIEESLGAYQDSAGGLLDDGMARSFDLGSKDMARAVAAGNVDVGMFQPSVSRELLTALSQKTDDVFSEVFSDLGKDIMEQIQRGAVGMQPASTTISRIARLIANSEEFEKNLRTRIGFDAQAEAIVRTETQRAFSVAHQAASEGFAGVIPGLKKVWVASGNGRQTHEDAEDRYSVGGTEGPIPVDAFFEVEDDSRTGESEFFTFSGKGGQRVARTSMYPRSGVSIWDKMLFPRDPSASAGNVCNCGCSTTEIIPGLEEAGEMEDEDLQESVIHEKHCVGNWKEN